MKSPLRSFLMGRIFHFLLFFCEKIIVSLTYSIKYANLSVLNAEMGSFHSGTNAESTRLVRGYAVGMDCRPGARFLKQQ